MSAHPASSPDLAAEPARLFGYDFTVLLLAATFGFCNIAVFYGLASHLRKLGIDPAWQGVVIAAEPMAAFLTRPFLSVWLTPRQALVTARAALVATGLVLPCYMLASSVPALIAVRVVHGLAFVCLVSAVMVLLAKTVPAPAAGRAFGLFSLSALVPYAIMPPFTEWLLLRVGGEAHAYAWTALLTLPSLALFVPLGRRLGRDSFSEEEKRRPSLAEVRADVSRPSIALLLGANLLLFAGSTQIFFFLKPFALSAGGLDPALFFTVCTAASIAVRVLAGPFYDRLPRAAASLSGLLGLAACAVLLATTRGEAAFLGLAAVYGLLQGVSLPLLNAAMFLTSEPRLRGMNMNLMLFMMDAGYTFGPLAAGGLLEAGGGYAGLFTASACCFLGSAGLLAPLALRELRSPRRAPKRA
ncbi:major facilitator superfamily MFS_1 [Desulfovibrio sp. X2]|uniref:MFS transporter n=1 Tax=Desulfovibrio sp. X2 TaxID=941449 RepID=UPI000358B165|nr:MFS transporter [Desulfovibrio sp. X2]EPR37694.1 major facilitator superfamily MFS_1 [Desulfovibrio sp. X2]